MYERKIIILFWININIFLYDYHVYVAWFCICPQKEIIPFNKLIYVIYSALVKRDWKDERMLNMHEDDDDFLIEFHNTFLLFTPPCCSPRPPVSSFW